MKVRVPYLVQDPQTVEAKGLADAVERVDLRRRAVPARRTGVPAGGGARLRRVGRRADRRGAAAPRRRRPPARLRDRRRERLHGARLHAGQRLRHRAVDAAHVPGARRPRPRGALGVRRAAAAGGAARRRVGQRLLRARVAEPAVLPLPVHPGRGGRPGVHRPVAGRRRPRDGPRPARRHRTRPLQQPDAAVAGPPRRGGGPHRVARRAAQPQAPRAHAGADPRLDPRRQRAHPDGRAVRLRARARPPHGAAHAVERQDPRSGRHLGGPLRRGQPRRRHRSPPALPGAHRRPLPRPRRAARRLHPAARGGAGHLPLLGLGVRAVPRPRALQAAAAAGARLPAAGGGVVRRLRPRRARRRPGVPPGRSRWGATSWCASWCAGGWSTTRRGWR